MGPRWRTVTVRLSVPSRRDFRVEVSRETQSHLMWPLQAPWFDALPGSATC